jgi:hypothetical protein
MQADGETFHPLSHLFREALADGVVAKYLLTRIPLTSDMIKS